ncbi:MAG: hypothetical protein R3E50_07480 [Halioglobus sp.]
MSRAVTTRCTCPSDKLAEQNKNAKSGGDIKAVDSSNIRELTNAVTEQLRRDAAAVDSRRGGR